MQSMLGPHHLQEHTHTAEHPSSWKRPSLIRFAVQCALGFFFLRFTNRCPLLAPLSDLQMSASRLAPEPATSLHLWSHPFHDLNATLYSCLQNFHILLITLKFTSWWLYLTSTLHAKHTLLPKLLPFSHLQEAVLVSSVSSFKILVSWFSLCPHNAATPNLSLNAFPS